MRVIHRIGDWSQWIVGPMLLLTTVFSFVHEQYLTAVVVALCAGLVVGIQASRVLFDRHVERRIEDAFDELFELMVDR